MVDSVRAINFTMFRQAIDRKRFTFPAGSKAAYLHDPELVRHDTAPNWKVDTGAWEAAGGRTQNYAVTYTGHTLLENLLKRP